FFNVRRLQDVLDIGSATAQPTIDGLTAYSRSVYEIASEAQAKTSEILKTQADEVSKRTFDALDRFAISGVPGSDAAATALKSALTASQTAYETFNKAAKQASEFVETSIASATTTTKATV
ncbi:MAG TPA: phasin family protein, partial [Burkholderiales bacterium]|nr:phasin family protein [Burkholderiales bacterium]